MTICLTCFVFKLYPLKDPNKGFDLENKGQGQIQGRECTAQI